MSANPSLTRREWPTQAERRTTTRRRLLDAALDVFARNGFHAASLAEIAANAGLSKGAIYWNFKSKEDLFLALLKDKFHEILANIRADGTGSGAPSSAANRFMSAIEAIPGWQPLYLDLIAYAARNPNGRGVTPRSATVGGWR